MSTGDTERPSSGLKALLSKFKADRERLALGGKNSTLCTSSEETDSNMISINPSASLSSLSSLRSVGGAKYGKKVKILGSGIAGKVVLYYKKSTNGFFAIKTFHNRESYESKEDYKTRCYKEYQIIQDFQNDHILRAFKFISGSLTHQIVFEYIPYSLLKVFQICKPQENEVLCFFKQVCEGIDFLHSNFIAHRDLKMENLVLDESGTVKIIDFGTAFVFGPKKSLATGIVGTESLMSPEAYNSLKYDSEANDVWSLGVLLYSMFNLKFPWMAARESDSEFKSFLCGELDLQQKFPQVIQHTISGLLTIDPQDRIKMDDLIKELEERIHHHSACSQKIHSRTLRICEKRLKITP